MDPSSPINPISFSCCRSVISSVVKREGCVGGLGWAGIGYPSLCEVFFSLQTAEKDSIGDGLKSVVQTPTCMVKAEIGARKINKYILYVTIMRKVALTGWVERRIRSVFWTNLVLKLCGSMLFYPRSNMKQMFEYMWRLVMNFSTGTKVGKRVFYLLQIANIIDW